jgi:hypothetical protein
MRSLVVAADALKAAKAPALVATFKRSTLPSVVAAARQLEASWKEGLAAAEAELAKGRLKPTPTAASSSASASAAAPAAAGGAGQASLLEFYAVANGGSGGAASRGGSGSGSSTSGGGGGGMFADGVPRASPAPKAHPADILASALSDAAQLARDDLQAALGYEYDDSATVAAGRVMAVRAGAAKAAKPGAPVVYWMSRDQRVADNWALLHAQARAKASGGPLVVVFNLVPSYLGAAVRAYGFMLRSVRQVEADLAALNIPFRVLLGQPRENVAGFANAIGASALVADFNPLRINAAWRKDVAAALAPGIAMDVVDAHNIVPCWLASDKQEVGARTIRRKIHTKLYEYVKPFPRVARNQQPLPAAAEASLRTYDPRAQARAPAAVADGTPAPADGVRVAPRVAGATDWAAVVSHLAVDWSVPEVAWCTPGERSAAATANRFLYVKLKAYDSDRNDPTMPGASSNLSPYLHFGECAERCSRVHCSLLFSCYPASRPAHSHSRAH